MLFYDLESTWLFYQISGQNPTFFTAGSRHRLLFACFRERHVKKCSRYHQEWSRGYKNSHNADVGCRSGLYSGRGPKSAIAEISTGGRTRGAPEIGTFRN